MQRTPSLLLMYFTHVSPRPLGEPTSAAHHHFQHAANVEKFTTSRTTKIQIVDLFQSTQWRVSNLCSFDLRPCPKDLYAVASAASWLLAQFVEPMLIYGLNRIQELVSA